MTGRDVDDAMIHEAFTRRAGRGAPDGLAAAIVARTAATPQSSRVVPARRARDGSLRLLAVAALMTGTIGFGVVVSGSRPDEPDPTPVPSPIAGTLQEAPLFVRPFTYRLDPALGLWPGVGSAERFALTDEAVDESMTYGGPEPVGWGITIADATDALVHPCGVAADSSRVPIRDTTDGLLEDLGAVGGVGIGPIESGMLDGREARSTVVDSSRNACSYADLHLRPGGIGSDFTRFDVPSRLTVTEVDGVPVLIQVWASTSEGLAAALPAGTAVVDSLHFTGGEATIPSPEPPQWLSFLRHFSYPVLEDGPLPGIFQGPSIVAFTRDDVDDPYRGADAGGWGITVSTSRDASTHVCEGDRRVPVREPPAEFLTDLEAIAGVGIATPQGTRFDGRPALVAMVDPAAGRCDGADYHLMSSSTGPGSNVRLDLPSRLTVMDVEGLTIVVQVWAGSRAALDAAMPEADAFLDGLHFTGGGTAS